MPASYSKYNTNQKPGKEHDFKIKHFFNGCRGCETLHSPYNESKTEKRGSMNLGENIRKARKAAGVTQKELAERLQVYQKDISRWENNELTPSAINLARICRALKASADEILELDNAGD